MSWAQDSIFQHPSQRWFPKQLIMFLQRASRLNIIPEIHVYSFKTLVARAARLHFQHHHEPEAGSEGGFKKHQYCFFIRPVCWTKHPKFMLTDSKLWMPGQQDCILQYLLGPEASPEGGIKMYPKCLFQWANMQTKIPRIHVYSFKLWIPGPQDTIFPHLHEPEAGLEGGIKKYQ